MPAPGGIVGLAGNVAADGGSGGLDAILPPAASGRSQVTASQQPAPGGGGEGNRLVLDAVFTAGTGEEEGPWSGASVPGRRPKTR